MPWTVQLIKLLSDNYFNFSSQSNKNFLLIKDKREHMNAYHNYWCIVLLKSWIVFWGSSFPHPLTPLRPLWTFPENEDCRWNYCSHCGAVRSPGGWSYSGSWNWFQCLECSFFWFCPTVSQTFGGDAKGPDALHRTFCEVGIESGVWNTVSSSGFYGNLQNVRLLHTEWRCTLNSVSSHCKKMCLHYD